MQKYRNKTQVFCYFILYIFSLFASLKAHAQEHTIAEMLATNIIHKSGLLADWFQTSNTRTAQFIERSATSNEIWNRVRQRFHLRAPSSAPLLQRHVKAYAKSQSYINELVRNASPYLYYVLEEVEKRGMPSEIALLPMIESEFNPQTKSHKGAVGLWQLMPSLGRLYGLKQNAWYDGRKDIYESTKVALDHLQYLHKRFDGNWLLALAAYNSGEYRVLNAMKKNRSLKKSTDFWSLSLPKETMHFVPKLLAIVTIIKSPKEYGVKLPNIANQPVFTQINTGKPVDISRAAKLVDVSETQLRKLNPGLHKKAMHPSGPFKLVVPISQANGLKNKVNQLNGVQTAKANTKANTKVNADKNTKISKNNKKQSQQTQKKKMHIVKKGESISVISKKYNIKVKTLLSYNRSLKTDSILQPGQSIVIAKN